MKVLLMLVFLVMTKLLAAQITIHTSVSPQTLAENIFGPDITVTNPVLHSTFSGSGMFTNGGSTNLGIDAGTVLTTGNANNIPNPGSVFSSQCNSLPNGHELIEENVTYQNTYDGCWLEFDVVPICSTLSTTYVFGSEEYPEYQSYAVDGFGIFISGANPSGGIYSNFNIALIPNTNLPISTHTINSSSNSAYYIDNTLGNDLVYDGFTIPMTAIAHVVPCTKYHVIIVIADGRDCIYDSGVFFKYQNNTCSPISLSVFPDTAMCPGDTVTLYAEGGADHYVWSPNTGLSSTFDSIVLASPPKTMVYSVTAYMGCDIAHGITEVVTVTVKPGPDVFIVPISPMVEMWDSITLTAHGAGSYLWIHSGSTSQSIVVSPNETTTYTVIGTADDSIWPCTAEATVMVEVISNIFIPNTFTPNGNDLNELFIPVSILTTDEIEYYEFNIFNQYGERIFTTNSLSVGWDGTHQNSESKQDVYVWSLKIKLKGRYERSLIGHVNLIR